MTRNGIAAEKLPDINTILGVGEKAQQDAEALLNMAFNYRRLQEMQKDEGLKDSDLIPGTERTFASQLKTLKQAYAARWKRINEEGHRANVEEVLASR